MAPRLLFGSGTLGYYYKTPEAVSELISSLPSLGISEVDTAARYGAPTNHGSETLLAEANFASHGLKIDTKILPDLAKKDGAGEATASWAEDSFGGSLKALKTQRVHTIYTHREDAVTDLLEQARTFDAIVRSGRAERWGVCSMRTERLKELLEVCEKNNLIKPSLYQGEYSAICRHSEHALLPLLHQHGISYNVFRVLASGFLSGRLTESRSSNCNKPTRFDPDKFPAAGMMTSLYDKPVIHAAMERLLLTLGKHEGISASEACLRWLAHHSALQEQDGIILGASSLEQLKENVRMIKKGPLTEDIVKAVDGLWEDEGIRKDITMAEVIGGRV